MSLTIPLGEENFSITTSALTANDNKVLACKGAVNQNIFLSVGTVFAVIAFILGCVLAIFVYATKNEDIDYINKVRKLVNSYRSFIQEIDGDFDTSNYQKVHIKTFVELLGIRDTIQSPILKWENGDRTMTRYEFAAMLFRALEKGITLDTRIINEFEPELGRLSVERIKGEQHQKNKIERVRVNDQGENRDVYGTKITPGKKW